MTYADKNQGNATYALNSYTWKLLEANLGWNKSDYDNGVAIIPSAQQPELMTTGNPFLTYGSMIRPTSHLYVLREESIAYNIYSKSSTEVNRVVNLISDAYIRQDDSARDVNEWLSTESGVYHPEMNPPRYVGARGYAREVSFTSIRTMMSERAEPTDIEGGYVSGFVLIEMQFVPGETGIKTTGFTYTP